MANRAMNIVNEFPVNKEGIKLMADGIVSEIADGNAHPLEVRAKIDAIEKIIKAVKEDSLFREILLDEADKHPDKVFFHNGIEFTKAESVKYQYEHDEVWVEIKAREKKEADDRKERETLLKALRNPAEIDGVICHPPVKFSSSNLRVKF